MSVLEKVKENLRKYPDAKFEEGQDHISIIPTSESGFTVTMMEGLNVFFNNWHQQFVEEEDALNCFAKGLSTECRLKETQRGDEAYRWTLEHRKNGSWEKDSTSLTLNFALWKKKTVHYLQNDLIK